MRTYLLICNSMSRASLSEMDQITGIKSMTAWFM